jgi:hypothetical protein
MEPPLGGLAASESRDRKPRPCKPQFLALGDSEFDQRQGSHRDLALRADLIAGECRHAPVTPAPDAGAY